MLLDTIFLNVLAGQEPLRDIGDFAGRIPHLITRMLTQCGKITPEGFQKCSDGSGKLDGEFDEYVRCYGFGIYLGLFDENSRKVIRTRFENYYKLTHERIQLSLDSSRLGADEKRMFEAPSLNTSEKDIILLAKTREEITPNSRISPYWRDYWFGTFSPVFALQIRESRNVHLKG